MKFINGKRRLGYSLIEISVALAILVILVFLLLGTLQRIRSHSNSVICLNNLRALGAAFRQFQNENNRNMPMAAAEGGLWTTDVVPYLQSASLLICPDFKPSGSMVGGSVSGVWYHVYDSTVAPSEAPTLSVSPGGWTLRTEGTVMYQAAKMNGVYPKIYFYFEDPTGEIDWSGAVTEHRYKIELVTPWGTEVVVPDAVNWAWYARNTTYRMGPYFNASVADFKVKVSLPNPSYVYWVGKHADNQYVYYDDDASTFKGPQSGTNSWTYFPAPNGGGSVGTTGTWVYNKYITPYRIKQYVNHDNDGDYIEAIWTLYINDTGVIGEKGMNTLPIGFSTFTPSGGGIASITSVSSTNMTTVTSSYGYNYLVGPTESGPYLNDQVSDHTILMLDYGALVVKPATATITGLTSTLTASPLNIPQPHSGKRVNVLFHNGRVESIEPSKIPLIFWTPQPDQ